MAISATLKAGHAGGWRKFLLFSSGSACAILTMITPGISPLHAAQSDGDSAPKVVFEEIVVSARKRDESLQSVPDSVSVFGARTIENAGITNIKDFAQLTPNLVITEQLRPGIQTVSLRGMTTVQGGQAPFAMIVDGVQQPSMDFINQELFDIERIEVLRGPQGTLYGGGAVGGAINVITKRPSDQLELSGKLGYSSGDTKTGTAVVSGPLISDKASFRASVFYVNSDGLVENTASDKKADFREEYVLRGSLYLMPRDNIDITLQASYTNGDAGALALAPVTTAQFDDFSILPALDTESTDKRELQSYSSKVDVFLDGVTLTSITSYNDADQTLVGDGDFSAAPIFGQLWEQDSRAFNQELRLTSEGSGPLRWVGGAFFQDRKIKDFTYFGGFDANDNLDPFSTREDVKKSESWAVFGQASYYITDALDLTLGLRYDRDKQTAVDLFVPGSEIKKPFEELQPKVSLSYNWSDSVMTYATFARGFRTGGFNPLNSTADRVYDNEVSDNFELGVKTQFLNNRLIVNVAAFHIDFSDQQFFFSRATDQGVFRNVINIPKTDVNGFEVEVTARPLAGLTLQGSVGYNDTTIKNFNGTGLFDGNRTPQVNKLTMALSADWTHPVTDSMDVIARVDYHHRGDVFWDIDNLLRTPSKDFVNLRLGLDTDHWTLALVGKNITDTQIPGAVGPDAFGPGLHLRTTSRTRSWGGEFRFRF